MFFYESNRGKLIDLLFFFFLFRIMTIISVVLGRTFHYVDEILPFRFENYTFRFKFETYRMFNVLMT